MMTRARMQADEVWRFELNEMSAVLPNLQKRSPTMKKMMRMKKVLMTTMKKTMTTRRRMKKKKKVKKRLLEPSLSVCEPLL